MSVTRILVTFVSVTIEHWAVVAAAGVRSVEAQSVWYCCRC